MILNFIKKSLFLFLETFPMLWDSQFWDKQVTEKHSNRNFEDDGGRWCVRHSRASPVPFSSSFNYKVINVHPRSVARLTIPDGKLQLNVIPLYTRRNPLVSV